MFNLVLIVFMGLPLLGVIAMETGEVSPFLDIPGRANGATLAYIFYLIAFFAAYRWTRKLDPQLSETNGRFASDAQARVDLYCAVCSAVFLFLAGLMLFAYGGLDVLLLKMDKAEFRISLGPLGAVMTVATKWLMPAMFAALVMSCVDWGWRGLRILAVAVCLLCLALVGASWGYKTTVLVMLLPAALVATRRVRLSTLVGASAFVATNILALSLFFDQHASIEESLDALSFRLTVLQGDLAWYTWDSAMGGYRLPDYWRTFLPVFGDGVLRNLTGADPGRDYTEWASYYFGPTMTLFGGYPPEGLIAGTSNQATLFSETLVIGGKFFFPFVAAACGAFLGLLRSRLYAAIAQRNYALSATLATFFSFAILSWLLGNGAASLIYLINIIGGVGTYLALITLTPRPLPRSEP
jgi:hypothetical protein